MKNFLQMRTPTKRKSSRCLRHYAGSAKIRSGRCGHWNRADSVGTDRWRWACGLFPQQALGDFAFTGLEVSDRFAKEHPEQIKACVASLAEAMQYIHSDFDGLSP